MKRIGVWKTSRCLPSCLKIGHNTITRSRVIPLFTPLSVRAYSSTIIDKLTSPFQQNGKEQQLQLPKQSQWGQPTHATHPHIITSSKEITRGISREEFELRRTTLLNDLKDHSVVLLGGYGVRYKADGIFYPFAQDTDLMYLCGMSEPDVAVILIRDLSAQRGYKMILFVRPRDEKTEIWDGPRTGIQGAMDIFGADDAYSIEEFHKRLPEYLLDAHRHGASILTDLDLNTSTNSNGWQSQQDIKISHNTAQSRLNKSTCLSHFVKNLGQTSLGRFAGGEKWINELKVTGLKGRIDQLRLYKSPSEIKLMREAGRITGKAVIEAMKATKPGLTEHQLWAILDFQSRMRHADGLAYVPVVAGGSNALTLHYVMNNQVLRDNDLVLVDVGAEYGGYASDVTRTWPVNGKFSESQRQVYEAVLKVQKECVKMCTESSRNSLDDIHRHSASRLAEEMARLFGVKRISNRDMNILYPHHLSHYLGMDVHDTETVYRSRRLMKGMVVTIEPGIYIPPLPQFPSQYHNIGIRIEDDVLVGEKEPIVLSVDAPKEVVDIEGLMGGITSEFAGR